MYALLLCIIFFSIKGVLSEQEKGAFLWSFLLPGIIALIVSCMPFLKRIRIWGYIPLLIFCILSTFYTLPQIIRQYSLSHVDIEFETKRLEEFITPIAIDTSKEYNRILERIFIYLEEGVNTKEDINEVRILLKWLAVEIVVINNFYENNLLAKKYLDFADREGINMYFSKDIAIWMRRNSIRNGMHIRKENDILIKFSDKYLEFIDHIDEFWIDESMALDIENEAIEIWNNYTSLLIERIEESWEN